MNPQVKEFLSSHRNRPTYEHRKIQIQDTQKWATYQQEVLLITGLFEKVYGPSYNGEFCHVESDPQSGEVRYYKRQPISVTEEEFALIQPYSPIAYNE